MNKNMKEYLESNKEIEKLEIIDNISYFDYKEIKMKLKIDNEYMKLEIYYNSLYCEIDMIKDEIGFLLNELYQRNYIFSFEFIDFDFDFIYSDYNSINIDEMKVEYSKYRNRYILNNNILDNLK